jgi:acetate kinase
MLLSTPDAMKILVANIGSTSFKYRLYDMADNSVMAQGRVERIGQPGGTCPNHEAAIAQCLHDLAGPGNPLANLDQLSAVGFKAVHAGPLTGARIVNDEVLAAMEEFVFLAPAHNPPYMAAMRAFQKMMPALPLVALFETAFFDQLSEAAVTYSVPYEWKQEHGIRRYGFHGASHRAASEKAQELLGRPNIRHISCHLGGSSSMAAVRDGVALDTTFGISAQSGLPHNNRTGDLDVFAVLFMMQKLSLSIDQTVEILSCQSGLAGISGTSGDMRDLESAAAEGNQRAKLAIDVLIRSIRHYIGAFYVELGGLDILTFSGGIGENSPDIRAAVCANLEILGIQLDPAANSQARGEARLSAPNSSVQVHIVPADEERVVARATALALKN